jgi:amino acid transporter
MGRFWYTSPVSERPEGEWWLNEPPKRDWMPDPMMFGVVVQALFTLGMCFVAILATDATNRWIAIVAAVLGTIVTLHRIRLWRRRSSS